MWGLFQEEEEVAEGVVEEVVEEGEGEEGVGEEGEVDGVAVEVVTSDQDQGKATTTITIGGMAGG